MLGHAIVQVWTYLAVDRFILASMITVCIYLKREYIFVFCTPESCPESASLYLWPTFQDKFNPVTAHYVSFLQYQLIIKY